MTMVEETLSGTSSDICIAEDMQKDEVYELGNGKIMSGLFTRFPRTFCIFFSIIIPMFFLIVVCFMCGHFLAKIEMRGEIEANDQYLREIFSEEILEVSRNAVIKKALLNVTNTCISLYVSSRLSDSNSTAVLISTADDAQKFINKCTEEKGMAIETFDDPVNRLLLDQNSTGFLSYDWTVCPMKNKSLEEAISPHIRSKRSAVRTFNESFSELIDELLLSNENYIGSEDFVQEFLKRVETISGHDHCHVNTPAGAFFWFTVMTTIGYGNAVPASDAGRTMVFSIGFISVLLFAAVSRNSGYVMLSISDDFFHNHNLGFLTKGASASFFWFFAYSTWNGIISSIVLSWSHYRSGQVVKWSRFGDSYWFAYISTTTIGFGDFYLQSEVIYTPDMIYIPLVLLMGFVHLANFLIKFTEWIDSLMVKYHLNIVRIDDLKETMTMQSQMKRVRDSRKNTGKENLDIIE